MGTNTNKKSEPPSPTPSRSDTQSEISKTTPGEANVPNTPKISNTSTKPNNTISSKVSPHKINASDATTKSSAPNKAVTSIQSVNTTPKATTTNLDRPSTPKLVPKVNCPIVPVSTVSTTTLTKSNVPPVNTSKTETINSLSKPGSVSTPTTSIYTPVRPNTSIIPNSKIQTPPQYIYLISFIYI